MIIIPYLRSRSELLARIRARLNDTGGTPRFSTIQIYEAMNEAILMWAGRVLTPFVYNLTDGFTSTTRDYSLPRYIDPAFMELQWKRPDWRYNTDGDEREWETIYGWQAYPAGEETWTLRLDIGSSATLARIIYYVTPGPIPITDAAPITDGAMGPADTSVALTTTPVVGRNGHILIGGEIMEYHGFTIGPMTLTNLVRGTHGTVAATHTDASPVAWMIPAHDMGLYTQLQHQTLANLQDIYLANTAQVEHTRYEGNWNRWQSMADVYWRRHIPIWNGSKKIRMAAAGAPIDNGGWMDSWWSR